MSLIVAILNVLITFLLFIIVLVINKVAKNLNIRMLASHTFGVIVPLFQLTHQLLVAHTFSAVWLVSTSIVIYIGVSILFIIMFLRLIRFCKEWYRIYQSSSQVIFERS
jgi:hypothetical protein